MHISCFFFVFILLHALSSMGKDSLERCSNNPCGPAYYCGRGIELGSYFCICYDGFEFNGKTCIQIDPCNQILCSNHGYCRGLNDGSYICICHHGYHFDGKTCIQVDPCIGNPCGSRGACMEKSLHHYSCICIHGYYFNGETCVRRQEEMVRSRKK